MDGYTENPGDLSWEEISSLAYQGQFVVYDRTSPKDILSRIKRADIVLTNKTPISGETIKNCPLLRYIGVLATGYDIVDVTAAKSRGIVVTNIPSYGTRAVAQFTMALLLELCHHVGDHSESVHHGDWERHQDFCYWNSPLIELAGKKIGIVGYGRIGRMVCELATAFGMHVFVYTPTPRGIPNNGASFVSLDTLLETSDVVTLHCPLVSQNVGIIGGENLERMKKGALLINTARGRLIEENDVARALRSGKLGGAALDVVSTEPIREDNPLLYAPNCILTPHIAWATLESRARLMKSARENLCAFLEGNPINVVE